MKTRTTKELFDLNGRSALVTGGSRGLGLQMAEALGEQGARLVLSARKRDELDQALEHLKQRGIKAEAVPADLSQEDAVAPLVEATLARLGQVDILINNAAATWGAGAEEYPLAAWDKVMNLNVRAVFLLSQTIGRQSMIPRGYGRIINIASLAGLSGNAPWVMQTIAYNSSKGALVNFTRALASEWGRYGITVNALAPGVFPSKMTKHLIATHGLENMAAQVPLQQVGDDEALKGATVLFASDAGKHITGQILPVDGGSSAAWAR